MAAVRFATFRDITPRGRQLPLVSSTYPENGDNMLFRSAGAYLQNYTVSDSSTVIITNRHQSLESPKFQFLSNLVAKFYSLVQ